MAEENTNSYKGDLGLLKAEVTRTDDPENWNRIQVYIPTLHGEKDPDCISSGSDLGSYPWAQMCSILFKDANNYTVSDLQCLYSKNVPMVLPSVGTIGWVMFEGNDTRSPVYVGSLGKGEENEKVYGANSSVGGDSNNLWLNSNSSILSVIRNIILGEESSGKYDSMYFDTNGKWSIGILQWNDDNARDLLERIRAKNPTSFDNLCNTYGANNLPSRLSTTDWLGASMSVGSAYYNAIKDILGTPESISAQDELCDTYISRYLDTAKSVGVTDIAAQIFYCDCANQAPSTIKDIAAKASDKSLNGLYEIVTNGNYQLGSKSYPNSTNSNFNRRTRVRNKIQELQNNGGLNFQDSTTLYGTRSIEFPLVSPVEHPTTEEAKTLGIKDCFTSSNYLRFNTSANRPYMTFFGDGIEGTYVYAAHDGEAKYNYSDSNGYGFYIEITNGDYKTRYTHLETFDISLIGQTKKVKANDHLGYVGMSGNVVTYQLDFHFLKKEIPIDPLYYFTDICDPNLSLIQRAVTWMCDIAENEDYQYSIPNRNKTINGIHYYDCSSFVTAGYIYAGLKNLHASDDTNTMEEDFCKNGFVFVGEYDRDISPLSMLRCGDVMYWDDPTPGSFGGHAICYIGDGVNDAIVEAKGKDYGIITSTLSSKSKPRYPWRVLRYMGGET